MLFNLLHIAPTALTDVPEEGAKTMWNLYSYICSFVSNETAQGILLLVAVLLCIASAYLIGSINPAIIFSKKVFNDDIRNHGSGNAGATNILRTYGQKMAIFIFALDFLKAAVAVIIGSVLLSVTTGGAISALFVVLGHMFPIYYKFKGGKGVSCTAACMLILSPISFAILLPIFLAIVLITKYVSLASIITVMLFPLLSNAFKGFWGEGAGGWINLSAIAIGAFVVFMHRANIKRLLEGKESKVDPFRKKKAEGGNVKDESKSDKAEPAPTKEHKNSDFVKCACGRLIPLSRKECVYCGETNPSYKPSENDKQDKSKKKK